MKITKILPFFGVFLFFYLLYRVGIDAIFSSFLSFSWIYLIPSTFFVFLGFITSTWKWQLILKHQGVSVSFWKLFTFYLIGNFYGSITPSRAGSLIRALYLKNYHKQKSLTFYGSSIILERLLDLFVILIFALFGSFFLLQVSSLNLLGYVLILLVLFFLASFIFLDKKRLLIFLRFIYYKFLPQRFKEPLRGIFYEFYGSLPRVKTLFTPLMITVLNWFVTYSALYFIALGLGISLPYFAFIMISAIISLVALVPLTVAGLGTREATGIFLYGLFGIIPSRIISMSILALVWNMFLPVLIGFLLSLREEKVVLKKEKV